MTQRKKAGDNGAGLLPWVQGLAPAHVAIIMDGNGRWASARGLPRSAGHRAGVDAVRAIVEAAPNAASRLSPCLPFPPTTGSARKTR